MQRMNNRGQFLLFGGLIGVIVIIALVIIAVFSQTFRWIMIGIILLIGTIWLASKLLKGKITKPKIFFLLILGGVSLFFIFGNGYLVQQQAFSVSNLKYSVQNGGSNILITGTPEGSVYSVDITPDDVNSQLQQDGKRATSSVNLQMEVDKLQYEYPLHNNPSNVIYQIQSVNIGNDNSPSIQNCQSNVGNNQHVIGLYTTGGGIWLWSDNPTSYCVVSIPYGTIGNGNIESHLDMDLKVTAGNQVAHITAFNQNVNLHNGKINVKYDGFLSGFNNLNSLPYKALFKNDQATSLISDSSYSQLINAVNTFKDSTRLTSFLSIIPFEGNDISASEWQSAIQIYQNTFNNAIANKIDNLKDLNPDIYYAHIDNNNVILNVNTNSISNPLLTVNLDGSLLNIIQLSGQPQIEGNINDINSVSGRNINTQITVKNIGENEGTFLFRGSCNNGFNINLPSKLVLQPNQEQQSSVQIYGVNTGETGSIKSANCNIIVKDENSGKTDSTSFNINLKSSNTLCQPGVTTKCSEDKSQVLVCNSNGDGFDIKTQCDNDFTCGLDGYVNACIKKGSIGYNPPTQNPIINTTTNNKTSINTLCEAKAKAQPLLGWTTITTTSNPSLIKKIFTLGFASSSNKTECKSEFLGYYTWGGIGIVALILISILIYIFMNKKVNLKVKNKFRLKH